MNEQNRKEYLRKKDRREKTEFRDRIITLYTWKSREYNQYLSSAYFVFGATVRVFTIAMQITRAIVDNDRVPE